MDGETKIARARQFHVSPSFAQGRHSVVLGIGAIGGPHWFYVEPALAMKLAAQLMTYAAEHAAEKCPVLESFRMARRKVRQERADVAVAANEYGIDREMLELWMRRT